VDSFEQTGRDIPHFIMGGGSSILCKRKDRGRCSICIGKARPSNARLHLASRLTCRLRFQTIAALTALRELWIRILSLWNLFQVKVQIQISILGTSQFWGRFLLLLYEERQSLRGSKETVPWLQKTKILILYGAEADLECDTGIGYGDKIQARKVLITLRHSTVGV